MTYDGSGLTARSSWPEFGDRPLALVPVGSFEQHGPHLPLDTDTAIAQAVTERVAGLFAEDRDGPGPGPGSVAVLPPVGYGASGEHQGFAGTVSIGTTALVSTLLELGRSLRLWAAGYVFVNGHGGNVPALREAVGQLRHEGDVVAWVPCAPSGADPHAGRSETSLMLHIRPTSVRLEQAEAGNIAPLADLMPRMREAGVRAVSPNGVLGDPAGASAAEGERLLEAMAAQVRDQILSLVKAGELRP